jgi:hypothetical protein
MSRQKINFRQLELLIADGMHLASFLIVEPTNDTPENAPRTLLADVCYPSGLQDGRVGFYEVALERSDLPKDLARLEVLVGIAKAQWARELDSALDHARAELQT